jgi:hypothetical protein
MRLKPGLTPAGVLLADAIGKIKLGGSLKGGAIVSTKDFGTMKMIGDFTAGGLFSGGKMHNVQVRGKMSTEDEASPLIMTARNGIDTLVINGDVKNAMILAGYNKDEEPVNPDARIGKIVVKGNWIQSSLVAGVDDSTGGRIRPERHAHCRRHNSVDRLQYRQRSSSKAPPAAAHAPVITSA